MLRALKEDFFLTLTSLKKSILGLHWNWYLNPNFSCLFSKRNSEFYLSSDIDIVKYSRSD